MAFISVERDGHIVRHIAAILLTIGGAVSCGMEHTEFEERYRAIRTLSGGQQFEPFEQLLAEQLTSSQRLRCLEPAAVAACSAKRYVAAVSLIEEGLTEHPHRDGATRARLLKARVWALKGLKRTGEALVASDEALKAAQSAGDDKISPSFQSQLYVQRADLMATVGRRNEAMALYRRSVSIFPSDRACKALYGAAIEVGDIPTATEAWIVWCTANGARVQELRSESKRLVATARRAGKSLDAAVFRSAQYRALPALAHRPDRLGETQIVLVEILAARQSLDAALYEAKVLFEACTSDLLPDAIQLLTRALRELDGNIARANRVLQYANFGTPGADRTPGTEDDLVSPLEGVAAPNREGRDAAYSDAVASIPSTWRGHMARAVLCRYWGRPKLALEELQAAYKLAPLEQKPMRTIMDSTALVLVQLSGDPAMADRYRAFQTFGPAGPDGTKGTNDDVTNPLEQLD